MREKATYALIKATGEVVEVVCIESVDWKGFISHYWYDPEGKRKFNDEEIIV